MAATLYFIALLLRLYWFILLARVIIEMIRSFSRQWRPSRRFALIAEPIFVLTDFLVKPLRRIIPPLRLGGVALDVSVLVLFFGISILTSVLLGIANSV
ncbi:MAG: YggT family protein [Corynebacterium sp.]|uniref:YggT family protein n=1 Tax=unclassified Corynebacterium TaxID=2624378 RepID=UPI0026471FAF|nr:YggT family protein [Corynebacterium sp.]MDN5581568.1 YggT family protein [Corynebacterium sp.]MDN5718886.1 YggT family protein [Corynebacterium sp.]MDN6259954.1 YggT family protein [Corynebacterium sp.]MDN6325486.1 YggT family protein [Corynebacterium sp.]MDN6386244.1 YggT family protein [Corynebacterium sp.]